MDNIEETINTEETWQTSPNPNPQKRTCCICGPVRNCGIYLDKVFQNIGQIASLFNDYKIVIVYDQSDDDTLAKLVKYKKQYGNKMILHVNQNLISQYRTHRLAYARNICVNHIRQEIGRAHV